MENEAREEYELFRKLQFKQEHERRLMEQIQRWEIFGNEDTIPALSNILEGDYRKEIHIAAIGVMARIRHEDAMPALLKVLEEDYDLEIRNAAIGAMGYIGYRRSRGYEYVLPALIKVLEEGGDSSINSTLQGAISSLGEIGDESAIPALSKVLEDYDDIHIREAAIRALGHICHKDAIPELRKVIEKDERVDNRHIAIYAIGNINHEDVMPLLCKTLLKESEQKIRDETALFLFRNKTHTWKMKIDYILELLQESKIKRSEIDAKSIVKCTMPSETELNENEYILTDYLISKAIDKDIRYTSILAKLILESAGDSTVTAGDRIKKYIYENNIPEEKLKKLRIEIGGETVIEPVLSQVLKSNIDDYFQKPIQTLNDMTLDTWKNIIHSANEGFETRKLMSIGIYGIGVGLVIISAILFFSGRLNTEQMFGAGVSFLSGIITIFRITYGGPLADIEKSVDDLGISSAAFIGYIHRVLEISHTFAFYYLNQKITYEEMEKSSKLIEDAMMDTNKILSKQGEIPSDKILKEVNENLMKMIQNSQDKKNKSTPPARAIFIILILYF